MDTVLPEHSAHPPDGGWLLFSTGKRISPTSAHRSVDVVLLALLDKLLARRRKLALSFRRDAYPRLVEYSSS
jgi:hypothetical protein